MNKILPPTILSHQDYYARLNKYALLMEQGLEQEAEAIKMNQEVVKYKNKLLLPLYQELKMIIKSLTYTEEHSVYDLYKETINRIDFYLNTPDNNETTTYLKDNLTYLFKRLISLIRLENEKSDNKLELIEAQLKSLTMILVLWNKYVNVIYTPDTELEKSMKMNEEDDEDFSKDKLLEGINRKPLEELIEENNPTLLKEYYMSRITDKKTKGTGLFLDNIDGLHDRPLVREAVEKDFEKVPDYKKFPEDEDDEEVFEEDDKKKSKNEEDEEKNIDSNANAKKSKKDKTKAKAKTAIKEDKKKLLENQASEVFEEEEDEEEILGKSSKKSSSLRKSASQAETTPPTEENFEKPAEKIQEKKKRERSLLEEYMLRNIKISAESNIIF
jgi:hypothetical protein